MAINHSQNYIIFWASRGVGDGGLGRSVRGKLRENGHGFGSENEGRNEGKAQRIVD